MLTELDKEWMQGAFLNFKDDGTVGYRSKTHVFKVISRQTSAILGVVKWHGAWWKYTFQPFNDTIWDAACLKDIIDFCELKTQERKAKWKTNGRKLNVPQRRVEHELQVSAERDCKEAGN